MPFIKIRQGHEDHPLRHRNAEALCPNPVHFLKMHTDGPNSPNEVVDRLFLGVLPRTKLNRFALRHQSPPKAHRKGLLLLEAIANWHPGQANTSLRKELQAAAAPNRSNFAAWSRQTKGSAVECWFSRRIGHVEADERRTCLKPACLLDAGLCCPIFRSRP